MTDIVEAPAARPEWERERLRYRVLRCIHTRTRADCEAVVTGPEIQSVLDLPAEQVFSAITFLSDQRYLRYLGAGPKVSLTPQGVEYVAFRARRRESVRD